jgi:hypothetical protein
MVEIEHPRGSSLLIRHVQKFEIKDKTEVPLQINMDRYTKGTGRLGNPTTHITLKEKGKDTSTYFVDQYSPTMKDPIRFYLDGLQEFEHGYQRKSIFPIVYRKSDSKLFIFTNIWHSDIFLSRITELKPNVDTTETSFDFEDFTSIPEIKNIWGVWEKVNLPHKKTNASFGPQVNQSVDVKLSQATSVNLKMEISGKLYTLTVSKNGRISSAQKLTKEELIKLYDDYFKSYLK